MQLTSCIIFLSFSLSIFFFFFRGGCCGVAWHEWDQFSGFFQGDIYSVCLSRDCLYLADMFELIQLFSDCCTRQLHCLSSARNFNRVRMRLEWQKNPDLYVLYMKAGERERDGVKQKRGTETQTARERLPRLTGGEQNDLGINGTGSPPGPSADRALCPG